MKPEEEIKINQDEEESFEVKTDDFQEEVIASSTPEFKEEKPIVYEIYTDGACSGNPGPGGYAAIILNNGEITEVSGGEKLTTNNKMELMGAISALKSVPKEASIKIYTDSLYVQKGITEWIANWKRKNFKDVKNTELWKELDSLSSNLNIEWHWVKAHSGNKHNEMADALAKRMVAESR
jgi:ribonuclease HI